MEKTKTMHRLYSRDPEGKVTKHNVLASSEVSKDHVLRKYSREYPELVTWFEEEQVIYDTSSPFVVCGQRVKK